MSALRDITVLDLSRILAGPWATQLLADFGATVIKIEKPGEGDDTRRWGPPWQAVNAAGDQEAAYFLAANRNKQSVTLDFTQVEGQQILKTLLADCDVLVENYKVGGLAKYGLDYASLRAQFPRLIYCSITGFGQTGPYAHRPGYDAIIQGMGGLMSITGKPDEEAGGGPVKVGVAVADLMTGMYAANAILAALHAREKSGEGQHIDLALFDAQLAWLANQAMNYLVSGDAPSRHGSAHPNIVPYQAFATADSHLMLAVGNDSQFRRCGEVLGLPALADDPRFASNAARVQHRHALVQVISEILQRQSRAHWLDAFMAAGVPAAPVNDLRDAFADPQAQFRQMSFSLPSTDGTPIPQVANPVRFSATPVRYELPPPALGADTETVLMTRAGLSATVIAGLRERGVI